MDSAKRQAILDELEEMVRCPVDWDITDRFEDTADFFKWEWLQVYKAHEVDRESAWIEDPYGSLIDPENMTDDEVMSARKNLRARVGLAAKEYIERVRRFLALTVIDPNKRPKHSAPGGGVSWPELVARTAAADKSIGSLLMPGIGPGQLLETCWAAIGELATCDGERLHDMLRERLFSADTIRLVVSTTTPIGACNGQESCELCLAINASAKELHAYPVTVEQAKEIRAGLPVVVIDDLEGFDDMSLREMTPRPFGTLRELPKLGSDSDILPKTTVHMA